MQHLLPCLMMMPKIIWRLLCYLLRHSCPCSLMMTAQLRPTKKISCILPLHDTSWEVFSKTVLAKVEEIEKGIFLQNVNIDRCRIEKSATYQSGLFLQILCKIILSIYPPKILCYSFATWKAKWKNKPLRSFFFPWKSKLLSKLLLHVIHLDQPTNGSVKVE